jgi:sugar lactone lactonase YvrE
MSVNRRTGLVCALVVLAIIPLSAQQLYITNEGSAALQLLDLNASTLSTLYTIGVGKLFDPDDLTVNSLGQLIYTLPNQGTVNLYDPTTGTNTILASGIPGARDLAIEPGGQTLLIAKYVTPPEILRYNFVTQTTTILVPKAAKLGTCDGIAYDPYGNLYAVANHNTIVQIDPVTGAILATLVLEPHNGVNGGDGLTYDSYTNSLWATHDGKVMGTGLIQIPVSPSGFTAAGFAFYPLAAGNVDGIKSDGKGNLYIGAIHTAIEYNIPTHTIVKNIVVRGADGVALVPGTY